MRVADTIHTREVNRRPRVWRLWQETGVTRLTCRHPHWTLYPATERRRRPKQRVLATHRAPRARGPDGLRGVSPAERGRKATTGSSPRGLLAMKSRQGSPRPMPRRSSALGKVPVTGPIGAAAAAAAAAVGVTRATRRAGKTSPHPCQGPHPGGRRGSFRLSSQAPVLRPPPLSRLCAAYTSCPSRGGHPSCRTSRRSYSRPGRRA